MTFSCETVTVHGLRLTVRRWRGDGPTLMLLHGLTDSGACWERVASSLGPRFDIVAPDARGHGQSDAPGHGYDTETLASDAVRIIEQLGLGSCILVGHSMGADTALTLTNRCPELVSRLVLEDPPWSDEWINQDSEQKRAEHAEWKRKLVQLKALDRERLLAFARVEAPNWDEAELVAWVQSKHDVSLTALDYILAAPSNWQAAITNLRCPALLVTGETTLGSLVPEALALEARRRCSQLALLRLAGAGHSVHRDQFAAYLEGLQRFLESLRPPTAVEPSTLD